jgi:hypothetical protein
MKEPGQVAYEAWHEAWESRLRDWRLIPESDKRAWAAAEQASAAKAWDEGYSMGYIQGPKSANPYRPEPAKGDSK